MFDQVTLSMPEPNRWKAQNQSLNNYTTLHQIPFYLLFVKFSDVIVSCVDGPRAVDSGPESLLQ